MYPPWLCLFVLLCLPLPINFTHFGILQVVRDVRRILNLSTPNQTSSIPSVPSSPIASSSSSPTTDSSERITARDLCHRIFFTCYMGTKNSSMETRQRAAAVAKEIGSTHLEGDIDNVVQVHLLLSPIHPSLCSHLPIRIRTFVWYDYRCPFSLRPVYLILLHYHLSFRLRRL